MRKLLFLIFSICCFAQAAFAIENVLSLSTYKFERGTSEKVYVHLDLSEERGAVQADMYLPEGVSIAVNNRGKLQAKIDTEGPWGENDITLSINDNGDFYTFLITSLSGDWLQAGSGYIFEMDVETSADAVVGPAKVMFKNSLLATTEGDRDIDMDDVEYPAEITAAYSVTASSSDEAKGMVEITGGGESVADGSSVTVTATPVAGYEFVNWTSEGTEVSTENPYQFTATQNIALVANFKAKVYDVKFVFDNGAEDVVESLEFGAVIAAPENPTKTGYTFGGWDPAFVEGATVPVDGITYTAIWTVNQYKLTFMVDDTEYKTIDVDYGATIEAESDPEKEGYTFSGWTGMPETMPDHDVTVTGSFTVNSYTLTIYLNDELYSTETVEYGAALNIENPTVPEGNIFDGWSETVPETMPAHDVDLYGTYSKDPSSGVDFNFDSDSVVTVYTLSGTLVYKDRKWSEVADTLAKGIYIVLGKKVIIK